MIEKRYSSFVTSNGLVPVDAICNKIGQGRTIEMLQDIFPKLTIEDIFESVHFYAEHTTIPNSDQAKLLDVQNTGTPDDIVIEVVNLHQTVYIKLLSVGHREYPDTYDFAKLMNQGLRICTLENIESFESEEEVDDTLHLLVNDAMQLAVPDVINNFELTKADLDYTEFTERRGNNDPQV
jgi:hypothetical protein|tara:strand:+ start:2223 stop:2762 length:540 start_codon:yes stop_codon:yes gene_type:complete